MSVDGRRIPAPSSGSGPGLPKRMHEVVRLHYQLAIRTRAGGEPRPPASGRGHRCLCQRGPRGYQPTTFSGRPIMGSHANLERVTEPVSR